MIGLDYFVAGYLQLASADIKCQIRRTPGVNVSASDTSVRYDHSRSQSQLDKGEYDTISPYGKSARTHVGGLMAGEVSISQNIRIYQETWPRLSMGCLYYDSIKVDLHIKPVIYIAREYEKGSCMYQSILQHEKKHIAVDRDIVAKYTAKITQVLDKKLKEIGYTHGPFKTSDIKREQDRLQTAVQETVQNISKEMGKERRARQQAVDTLQEYDRVQARCRGQI